MISKSKEDYLETILNSLRERGHAKTKEIAKDLEIAPSSVTEMFRKLESDNLVTYQKYRGVTLTDKGARIAKSVRDSHLAMKKFFQMLQVSEEQAEKDACKVEHDLGEETIYQLKKFVFFVENCPKGEPEWIYHFKKYSETGEFPEECL
ncbi:MAG: metal-dependent transcriptional regulator [Thermoplasmatota archaeon]